MRQNGIRYRMATSAGNVISGGFLESLDRIPF